MNEWLRRAELTPLSSGNYPRDSKDSVYLNQSVWYIISTNWRKSIRQNSTPIYVKKKNCPECGHREDLHVCMLSYFRHAQLYVTLWTVACQAALSMVFSRKEYLSGLPCPPPGDFPNPGIEPTCPRSALAGRFFTTSTTGKPRVNLLQHNIWQTHN